MVKSLVDDTIRSEKYVRCKLNYECKQNDICENITSEVQKIKIAINKEDTCKHVRQRNLDRKCNNNTSEENNKHYLINSLSKFIIRILAA
jgi:hypothetical protein